MWHCIKPRNDKKIVPNSLIFRAIACIFVITFLFPFSSSMATGASTNDSALTENVTIALDNRVQTLNIFLSPGAGNIMPTVADITTTVSKRTEMPRTNRKIIIAGGVGKRILTASVKV